MDQDQIIEVHYGDNVDTQVITIDLPNPPSSPSNQNAQQTIDSYATMTQLQSSETVNNDNNSQNDDHDDENNSSDGTIKTKTRFKWSKEKTQVAMNLVKHGCKPKLVSVAVGCSLRTAQKFVETVSPKMEGESFKNYEIRRRGRKSKDVNHRLEAIKEVLSKDSTKTQVEIAADLKVSNTTVCRDLKRIGASWREKKNTDQTNFGKRAPKKDKIKSTPKLKNSPRKEKEATIN